MFRHSTEIIQTFTSPSETKQADYLKRENSNFVYSLPLLRHNLTNFAEEEYLLQNILPAKLTELYRDGVIYIHDHFRFLSVLRGSGQRTPLHGGRTKANVPKSDLGNEYAFARRFPIRIHQHYAGVRQAFRRNKG